MKCLVVVLTVCIVGAFTLKMTDEQNAILMKFKDVCITESGIDADLLNSVLDGDAEMTRDHEMDCFSACIMKKTGVMRADGSIDVEATRAEVKTSNVNNVKADEVIDKCILLVGKEACETGGNFFNCFVFSFLQ